MMELHENIDEALLLLYFSGTLGESFKELALKQFFRYTRRERKRRGRKLDFPL